MKQPEFLRKQEGYKVYLVDGDELIEEHALKYFWGSHFLYFPWIPKNCIYVRKVGKDMNQTDIEVTIAHEIVEVKGMGYGLNYRRAHNLSELAERCWRSVLVEVKKA